MVLFGLTLAAPPGALPADGRLPVSWLWSWLSTRPLWALPAPPPGPQQVHGTAAGKEHHVSADKTRADGGAGKASGHAPGHAPGAQAEYRLPSQTGKPTKTPSAAVFDPKTSRRVPAKSSRASTVYQNADGSLTRLAYGQRVNYLAANGSWQPIETALKRGSDQRFHMTANSVAVSVAAKSGQAKLPLAEVRLATGQTIAYDLEGISAVAPKVADSTAVYSGILPDTDLELTTFGSGLKETIVLRSPQAPTSWVFPLQLTGLTPSYGEDGSIALLDSGGKAVAWFPQGSMQDSKVNLPTGEPVSSSKITYELVEAAGGPALKVTADEAWLHDPARVYPVRVDPTATTDTTGDAYVDDDPNTGTSTQNGDSLAVGTDGQAARSFIHFDNFGADGFTGKRIVSARLRLFHTWSWDCITHHPVYVHKVTQSWTVANLSTATLPGPTKTSAIGTLNINDNYPACTNTGAVRSTGQWWWVSLNTGAFNDWSTGGANNGLALTSVETDTKAWKRFTSANYSSGAYAPYLELTYADNVPPQVDAQYPYHGYASPTLTPELLASAQDPDAFPKSLTYDFLVYDKAGTKIADSGWVTSRSWTVPAGKLVWGETYFWTVAASDGILASGSQTTNMLTTPVPQPLITSGLSPNGDKGFDPDDGDYTTSVTDATVATYGPSLAIDRSYNSVDPRVRAFGSGWATVVDAKVTEQKDVAGALQTVVITYPNGQDVAFGRNADGTFSPPTGRFATFTTVTGGGYKLIDKDATEYAFTRPTGTAGQYAITSISDAQGRAETFGYDASGNLTTFTAASGRRLTLTWQTPTGASTPHVATVSTDAAVPGDANTVQTWQYSYTGDKLTKVCPPDSATACWTYGYTTRSLNQSVTLNAGPHSYWRLNEGSGSVAKSAVIDRAGKDNATYANVTLGQPGPLAGSTSTAAGFNGTSASVALPADLVTSASYRAVSMWFKTSGGDGVLFGQSWDADSAATTTGAYNPTLYIGSDGKLMGQFPTAPAVGALGTLVGNASHRCLDVEGAAPTNGARVYLYDCHGGANQQWTLDSSNRLTTTISGVTKCLDATGASTADGTDIQIWGCGTGTNQQWNVLADGRIIGVQSGKCLDAELGGTANGTYTQLWPCKSLPNPNQTWFGSAHAPMQSPASVADGQWHHVVLSANGTSQKLYLDGVERGSKTGIVQDIADQRNYLGTGFLGGSWPNQSHTSSVSNVGTRDYFAGSMAEVAFFDTPITADIVQQLYAVRSRASDLLSSVVRPSGKVSATVSYDPVTGDLTSLVDGNGGTWGRNAPTVAGTSQVYASTVIAGAPFDYWRMAETGVSKTVNQVNGIGGTYSAVTLGVSGGPFSDATVASFNGTSSYVQTRSQMFAGPSASASMWFQVPSGNTAGGVLLAFQSNEVVAGALGGSFVPAVYVGTDGKLRGKWCWCGSGNVTITSAAAVNDGKWHHVALTLGGNVQKLYLDGAAVGSLNLASESFSANYAYIGAGFASGWASAPTNPRGFFPGKLSEVALYKSQLSDGLVAAQFAARDTANLTYGKWVTVTDPAGKSLVTVNDINTGRKILEYDARGGKSQFGYDTSGFLRTVIDPNGNGTITEHDVRGNTISQSTCQDWAAQHCSTLYYSYYPDATTKVLTPDPRNDLLLTTRDAASSSASDTKYLTTYTYDVKGNRTQVTDPLGRITKTDYTNGTSDPAVGGGLAPAGLPKKLTTPGGAIQTLEYFANGDLARTTDATGKVTNFTYDGLGRGLTQTDVTDTFPAGVTTAYAYDRLNRVVTETQPGITNRVTGAVHTAVTTTSYDPDGNIAWQEIADTTGGDAPRKAVHTYNQYGQRASTKDPDGKTTSFTYDAFGRILTETEQDGSVTASTYDENGNLLESIIKNFTGDPNNPSAPTDLVVLSKAYDPAGRVASETDAEGTTSDYYYTDNGLVQEVDRYGVASGGDSEWNDYDVAGNLVGQYTNDWTTYTWYNYDAAGRRTSSTVDPGGARRVTTYAYDADDHLLATTLRDATGTVVSRSEQIVDPLGRVMQESTFNSAAGSGKLTLSGATGSASCQPTETPDKAFDGSWASGSKWCSAAASLWVQAQFATTQTVSSVVVRHAEAGGESYWYNTKDYDIQTSLDGTTWTTVAQVRSNDDSVTTTDLPAPVSAKYLKLLILTPANNGNTAARIYEIEAYNVSSSASGAQVSRTTYTRDKGGLAKSVTDPNGNTTFYDYDEAGRAVKTTSPAVQAETGGTTPVTASAVSWVGFDTFGAVTDAQDATGNRSTTAYDAAGRMISTTSPAYTPPGSTTPLTPVTIRSYDETGQLTSVKDPLGGVTSLTYDQLGNVAKVTAANGGVSTFTYDKVGNRLSTKDPNGVVSSATYDALGLVLTKTVAVRQTGESYTTSYDYTNGTWLDEVTSPSGATTEYTYNYVGEVVSTKDPAGNITKTVYDAAGRVVRTTAADGTYETNTYDMSGRQLSTSSYNAAGTLLKTESGTYDSNGNQLTSVDARGTTTTFAYDATNLLTSETQPISAADAITTTFGYDLNGNRTRFTDGRGNPFITTYNSWNLPESSIEPATAAYPDASDRTYTISYDELGRAVTQTAPGGVSVSSTYDNMSRLRSQSGSGAEVATASRTFDYDIGGRMTSLSSPGGTATLTYDDRGLPLSITGPSGDSSFTYTASGLMATRQDAAGTTTYGYDGADRLISAANASRGVQLGYAYNSLNQVSKTTYGGSGNTRWFGFDELHRVVSDELKTTGGTSIGKIAYGWDANGNETSKTTTGFTGSAANTYTYDLADRLTSWNNSTSTVAYAYDKSGNRTQNGSVLFTYDARNRLMTGGTTTYAYTARGTLSSATTGSTVFETKADAYGQVLSQGAAGGTQTYTYDGLGRVVKPGFAYTGLDNDLATDGTGLYTRGPSGEVLGEAVGTTQRLAWTDLHTDVVGQFTDTGTALDASTTYDPLGKVVATSGMLGNLGYQSEWTDSFTGRVNMLARWYNTETGQFDTRDTASNSPTPDSINADRYQYGDGNPLTVTDPSGHWGFSLSSLVNKARSAVSSAVRTVTSAASSVWNAGVSAYHGAQNRFNEFRSWAGEKAKQAVRAVNTVRKAVGKAISKGRKFVSQRIDHYKQKIKKGVSKLKQAGAALKAKAQRVTSKVVKGVKDAYKATEKWVSDHKAAIVGFAVALAVGSVCMVATFGMGSVGCMIVAGAVGGALGNLAAQGVNCADKGGDACSTGAFVTAGVTGFVGGAVGGLAGPIGGKIAGAIVGDISGSLGSRIVGGAVSGAISGAVSGAASGGAVGALGYGIGCASGAECSASGFVNATATGMKDGAIGGAIGGGIVGGFNGAFSKAPPSCHSFAPATAVVMADGSQKPIKDVQVGDQVKATDPVTGKTTAKTVTGLHNNEDRDLADVTVASVMTGKTSVVHTTAHHPFWDADRHRWTDAAQLKPGTHLRDADGKTAQMVTAVKVWTGLKWMRDLTVDEVHTYYVAAGGTAVLVHNCGEDDARFVGDSNGGVADREGPRFAAGPNGEITDRRPPTPAAESGPAAIEAGPQRLAIEGPKPGLVSRIGTGLSNMYHRNKFGVQEGLRRAYSAQDKFSDSVGRDVSTLPGSWGHAGAFGRIAAGLWGFWRGYREGKPPSP